jgi:hypothetical protein
MRYGLVKSALDAHTLGLSSVAQLLEECGYEVFISDAAVAEAVDEISKRSAFEVFKKWILDHRISHLGFSYRLDPAQALEAFGRLIGQIERDKQVSFTTGGFIKQVYFAGLPESCSLVDTEFGGRFETFVGDETPSETLRKLGVPESRVPRSIKESAVYDELRLSFGKSLIKEEKHYQIQPFLGYDYGEYGTAQDHLITRLAHARRLNQLPLTRAHVGPYLKDREKALALFSEWLRTLAKSRLLDIVSVGSSQLSQSKFGEDWEDLPNGGGVPFNSAFELRAIREDASPLLVRAYSATNSIPRVAKILEENLNMAWHALSLWWFNRIDGRGPLSVKQGLAQHIETMKYIASVGKPYEPNLPHHFAFRGADDLTYIVSAYLAAKTAKLQGIKYLVLQNMLNTPKFTWGVRDLAKARALLNLVRKLEDKDFRLIYQPRAGLDYFSPDAQKAKEQLAAVTALMDDVEPENSLSPEIIHVVSYSEALFLADPEVIDESVQITRAALKFYRDFRKRNAVEDIIQSKELAGKTEALWEEAVVMIEDMEKNIRDLYTSDGLYTVFKGGYFPVPYLWEGKEEFTNAVDWTTKIIDGGIFVVDERGKRMSVRERLERIRNLQA